ALLTLLAAWAIGVVLVPRLAPELVGAALALPTLAAGHVLWLLLWAVGITAVSALMRRGRDALLTLLAAWAIGVVLVPRLAPELVGAALALPT
ncbi:hypothetical protein, partial [Escherichia coli]|uniref:hypothetical protein n=1 Tax=Escherichia coli TaxID=562 RepID=UPI001BC87673